MCLADFISPDSEDWIGGFAVGIHGLEPHLERFKQTVNDYDDILLKALADRLAEALRKCFTPKFDSDSGAIPRSISRTSN